MKIPFVDLHTQYLTLKTDIDAAISDVIANTAFVGFANNPYVTAFQEHFAAYTGAKHCIGCANGTDAIELALRALNIGPEDEVIVPAQTWISTAEAVTAVGAQVRFVDTQKTTQNINSELIEAAITSKTKAVIAVHLRGLPADLDPILEITQKHGLFLLEDCAQAHGAIYKDRHVGTFGIMGTFSFFPGKTLGAYGDAGGIITNDDLCAEKLQRLVNHGSLHKGEHLIEGRNSRLDGLQAAILDVKLPYLQQWVEARRKCAALYSQHLQGSSLLLPGDSKHGRHAYHLYVIESHNRDELAEKLNLAGYPTGIHYPRGLPFLQCYAYMQATEANFPVAFNQPKRILSLPIFPELSEEHIEAISRIIS
ncbi:MAG: DegT/DnrJ/EryC1/StrS family aminotransferase [Opitutales bacterium]|nr:DegT/DnrJ/EryC1/StrS family aminotransferase [Opitutales bacterium]